MIISIKLVLMMFKGVNLVLPVVGSFKVISFIQSYLLHLIMTLFTLLLMTLSKGCGNTSINDTRVKIRKFSII